jgi:hypothetical protein
VHIGGNPREIAITGGDRLDLEDVSVFNSETEELDLTPTFNWEFKNIPDENIKEVNLFVSVFDKGEGLLPWDEVVDLSDTIPNLSRLDEQQKLELLTRSWKGYDDFNPNRILTATWKKETGKWYDYDSEIEIGDSSNTNTSFTLPDELTLTAGQKYHWAVQVITDNGYIETDVKDPLDIPPPPVPDDGRFSSVTIFTHGFENQEKLQPPHYARAFAIAKSGAQNPNEPSQVFRYSGKDGEWKAVVDKQGRIDPNIDIKNASTGKPLVLLIDWASHGESVIPDSGFSEGAADAVVADLAKLDKDLENLEKKLFSSPMHFIGHSRGTIVTSEMVQRMGTYFGDKVGTGSNNDLHLTYLDAHDFKQNLPSGRFNTFYEPSVQVWENVTFADNYFQEVPESNSLLGFVSPSGRNIPNDGPLPADPAVNPPVPGEPNISIRLGAHPNSSDSSAKPRNVGANPSNTGDYSQNFAGFAKDRILEPGPHARVNWWYDGTIDLSLIKYPPGKNEPGIYRRLSDAHYNQLFNRDFYDKFKTFNPWYQPDHIHATKFKDNENDKGYDENAPWEGIGTGWFYSVLGGGKDLRPSDVNLRTSVGFDNTFAERMRGDEAVPTIFNGNFDAVTTPRDRFAPSIPRPAQWRYEMPGWAFHNGTDGRLNTGESLFLVDTGGNEANPNYALKMGDFIPQLPVGDIVIVEPLTEITHNRMYVSQNVKNLKFDIKVTQQSNDDTIVVSMGEDEVWQQLEQFELADIDNDFRTVRLNVPDNFPGTTSQLKFELLDGDDNTLDAKVLLDNISFERSQEVQA